jgi:hypothetical protein
MMLLCGEKRNDPLQEKLSFYLSLYHNEDIYLYNITSHFQNYWSCSQAASERIPMS